MRGDSFINLGLARSFCSLRAIVLRRFSKSDRSTRSGAGTGRVALYSPFLLLAFLCGSFRQRKAAKWFCYQNGYNAFSFEARGPKEKALQKENAVFLRSRRAGVRF